MSRLGEEKRSGQNGNGAVQLHSLPPALHAEEEEDDTHEEHALAGASAGGPYSSASVSNGSGSSGSGLPPSVSIHTNGGGGGGSRGHRHNHSLVGMSDVAVELSPTLGKGVSRSDGGRSSSMDQLAHDHHHQQQHDGADSDAAAHVLAGAGHSETVALDMPPRGQRSSMIGVGFSGVAAYDAAGHGGGDEEMEHVLPNSSWTAKLEKLLNHFAWNLAILLLIAGDIVLIIFKVGLAQTSPVLLSLTVILIGVFLLEIAARIVAFGRAFFKNIFFVIYSLSTIGAFMFLLDAFQISIQARDIVAIVLQCTSAFLRFAAAGCELAPAARAMVSTNKARYQQHGFNLDLTYITDRIIAMGLPSTKIEAVYRNPIEQVAKFFNKMHKDHYLIVNLCSERTYPTEKFHGRVVGFPFDDHNPPPLSTMLQFCVYVEDFLRQDKDNVVAVHCKGGKGRTGTMCVAWLLYSKPDMYAEQALKLFATYRTAQEMGGKLQGVSGPSQKRYVGYFEQLRFVSADKGNLLRDGFAHLRTSAPMELVTLTLNHVAPVDKARALASDEKARDVHNITWNQSSNWSLLITHYAPISTFDDAEEKAAAGGANGGEGKAASSSSSSAAAATEEDPEHWTATTINRRNQARYSDTREFYFPAREKDISSQDDSVIFDMASFHAEAKSLILSGDLKFQVFRGNLALGAPEQNGADGPALGGAGGSSGGNDGEKPFCYCWFWLNTAFANQNSTRLVLRKEQIDEVARDKQVDPEMNLHLDYFSPPRPASWSHAAHPTFHLVPNSQPLSPKTPKNPTQDESDEDEEEEEIDVDIVD